MMEVIASQYDEATEALVRAIEEARLENRKNFETLIGMIRGLMQEETTPSPGSLEEGEVKITDGLMKVSTTAKLPNSAQENQPEEGEAKIRDVKLMEVPTTTKIPNSAQENQPAPASVMSKTGESRNAASATVTGETSDKEACRNALMPLSPLNSVSIARNRRNWAQDSPRSFDQEFEGLSEIVLGDSELELSKIQRFSVEAGGEMAADEKRTEGRIVDAKQENNSSLKIESRLKDNSKVGELMESSNSEEEPNTEERSIQVNSNPCEVKEEVRTVGELGELVVLSIQLMEIRFTNTTIESFDCLRTLSAHQVFVKMPKREFRLLTELKFKHLARSNDASLGDGLMQDTIIIPSNKGQRVAIDSNMRLDRNGVFDPGGCSGRDGLSGKMFNCGIALSAGVVVLVETDGEMDGYMVYDRGKHLIYIFHPYRYNGPKAVKGRKWLPFDRGIPSIDVIAIEWPYDRGKKSLRPWFECAWN